MVKVVLSKQVLKIASAALLVALATDPANSATSGIGVKQGLIVDTPESELWQNVPNDLNWTKLQIDNASEIINERKAELQKILDEFKNYGANRVVQKNNASNKIPDEYTNLVFDFSKYYPALDKKSFRKVLIGFDGNKKIQKAKVALPARTLALGDYLITLKTPKCSLSDFYWFNPLTWFVENRCEILTPTPKQYLRASLISELWLHNPNQSFDLTRRALANLISGHYNYMLDANMIRSADFGMNFKLSEETVFSKYKISFGQTKWAIHFNLTVSDLNIFAKHLQMLVSYGETLDAVPQTRHFLALCGDNSASPNQDFCEAYPDNGFIPVGN